MPLHPQLLPIIDMLNESTGRLADTPVSEIQRLREEGLVPPVEEVVTVARVQDSRIPGPAGDIPVRIYTPPGEAVFPLVVFYHGGGFVLGDIDTHDDLCRTLCRDAQAVVVSVQYRLAPEAKYPAAPDDCYAALVWCAANAGSLGADGARIAVAGDSAGGNLAAATALRARDMGGPLLRHQALIYPVTACAFDTESYRDNADGYFLSAAAMRWFWGHYLEHEEQAREAYASPLYAAELSGLPSATVITAEFDPLRDEGEAYADRLAAAGVAVTSKRYAGMIHGFVSLGAGLDAGAAARGQLSRELRAALA